jgi:acyl carrier protein
METIDIEDIIIRSLKELIEVLNVQMSGPLESDTRLFGPKGALDSMGLVSLITDLEERIEDEYDISLILADERAMSQEKSPFRTVSTLAQYISMLLDDKK